MRVLKYLAHNVLRLSDITFDLTGYHLFLVGGKNGHGKSSALTALKMALCGKTGMDRYPEIALKDGENEGWVKCDLAGDEGEPTGLTVELFLRRKRGGQVVEQLRVVKDDGSEVKEPRTLLQRLFQLRGFDPLAFERLDKKKKRDTLQKLVGLDFSEQEKEYKRIFDERTDVNRDGTRLRARFDAMPQHKDAPTDQVNVQELMEELDERREANEGNAKLRKRLEDLDAAATEKGGTIADLKTQIADLERQLNFAEADYTATVFNHRTLASEVQSLKDADESAVKAKIASAEEVNRKVRENAERAKVEKELIELRAKSEALGGKLEGIRASQQKALQEAQWPVPGLSLDEDGVLYQNLPFEQAAKSLRVTTSAKIGMALNPKLRLLVCEDGNDLDSDCLDALEALLKEKDYQMILEMVTRSADDEGRCAVIIEDGKTKN